ncbi:MAG: GNAT family protein [Chloroflexota bacterium]
MYALEMAEELDDKQLEFDGIVVRSAIPSDKELLFKLITEEEEWTKFNGPYFPYTTPTMENFSKRFFVRLSEGDLARVIDLDGKPVGTVTYYWESEDTRWLEIGIAIYAQGQWGKGIGRKALTAWVTHMFNRFEIERVGLTTWSGNPRMIACAKAIGMQVEGTLRKVRYYNGVYYDSIKMGVLREEWFKNGLS